MQTDQLNIAQETNTASEVNASAINSYAFNYYGCTSFATKHRIIKKKKASDLCNNEELKAGADELKIFKECKPTNTSNKKRYEIGIIYFANKVNKLRVRKVRFGNYVDAERKDMSDEEIMVGRQKYAKLLIDSDHFDHQIFVKTNGFFNAKFWDVNVRFLLSAGSGVNEAVGQLDSFLKEKYGSDILTSDSDSE